MTFNQVHNMDEITHARAVRRVVVRPKYGEGGSLADRDLGDEWHQIVRHTGRAFANKAAVVSAIAVNLVKFIATCLSSFPNRFDKRNHGVL